MISVIQCKKDRAIFSSAAYSITWESVNAHITMEAFFAEARHEIFGPVSQENLSPRNCVAATVFPSRSLNVATVYPMSPGNTVARMLAIVMRGGGGGGGVLYLLIKVWNSIHEAI